MAQYGVSFVATVYAWDTGAGTYKTGDSANIVLKWLKDGTSSTTTNACAEVSASLVPGQYKVTMTAAEATCTAATLGGASSTSGIIIIPQSYAFDAYTTVLPAGPIPGAGVVENGTFVSATSTTAVLRVGSTFGADNNPNGMTVYTYAGTGLDQTRVITGYVESTRTITVDTWTTTPDNTTKAIIYPSAPGSLSAPTPVKVVAASGSYGVKKNTALASYTFFMTDSTTHTAKTGATVTVQRSIDGAAFANATNTPATELSNGVYTISLSAADLNGNTIMLKCTGTGCDQRMISIITSP